MTPCLCETRRNVSGRATGRCYNFRVLAYRIAHHGGPEALEWCELPRPEPRADEVLVRVRACGLNHLDLWVRNGVAGHRFPLPLIPGSEIVLTVGDPEVACNPPAPRTDTTPNESEAAP